MIWGAASASEDDASARRAPHGAGDGNVPHLSRQRLAEGQAMRRRTLTPLPPVALGLILLAEGYASLGTETLALRRLVPWQARPCLWLQCCWRCTWRPWREGTSAAGRLARLGTPRPRLSSRLSAAAALAAFWLSEIGTPAVFGLPAPTLAQVAVYSVTGIAPVGWLLAECVLLSHAFPPPGDAAETAGGIFSLSTVGSVPGAPVTTFLLLRFLGTVAAYWISQARPPPATTWTARAGTTRNGPSGRSARRARPAS